MKAIETKYKGYRFRSRLEARWAVFFDALGLEWEYEPEGFDLDGDWYLPDFWVPMPNHYSGPGAGYWCEIKKPGEPSETEKRKARNLARLSGHNTMILSGSPYPGCVEVWKFCRDGRECNWGRDDDLLSGKLIGFYLAYPCGAALASYEDERYCAVDWGLAAQKARSARFEHGECPA
jgi:hypothetical protein